jgi:aspartate aminotransferase
MDALRRAVEEQRQLAFQYTPFGGRTITRRRIAAALRVTQGIPFDYEDIVMTPGAMSALNVAFRTLFSGDDEVILLTPCWMDYPLYLRNLGIPFRMVPKAFDKHIDLDAVERALSPRTRGILFSQPCCPTGVLYNDRELAGLGRLLAAAERRFNSGIWLLSDESHAELVWSGAPVPTPLSWHPRAVRIYSFGKKLFLQGQRTGYLAVSPQMPEREELRREFVSAVRMMGFCTPTTLMQHAVCRLLDYRPPLEELASRQKLVRDALLGAGYEVCSADATFFTWVKSPLPDSHRFVELLADEGVLTLPGTIFHEEGWFRIAVTPHWPSLLASLPVFERVMRRADAAAPCLVSA